MTIRRQKKIADTAHAIERALDLREELLARLVRCELQIRKLKKRNSRAQKAFVAKGDSSVAAGVAPSPFSSDLKDAAEFSDDIPL